jgi:hypothetical protein
MARDVRGQARLKLRRHTEAVEDYSALLVVYPRNASYFKRRADCYEAMGKHDLARTDRAQADKVTGRPVRAP